MIFNDLQALLFPSGEEMNMLSIVLTRSPENHRRWERFCRSHNDPKEILGSLEGRYRRMLALIYYGLRRNSIVVPRKMETYFRIAETREKARNIEYWKQTAQMLGFLDRVGAQAVLIRGAGPSLHAYPKEIIRHSHDVDLLIDAGDRDRICPELIQRGFIRREFTVLGRKLLLGLMHPSELEFILHTHIGNYAGQQDLPGDMKQYVRHLPCPAGNGTLPVISLEMSLIHCLQGLYEPPNPKSLYLFIDLYYLLRQAHRIDWEWVEREIAIRMAGLACGLAVEFFSTLGEPLEDRCANVLWRAFKRSTAAEYSHGSALARYDKFRMLRLILSGQGFNRIPLNYAGRRIAARLRKFNSAR